MPRDIVTNGGRSHPASGDLSAKLTALVRAALARLRQQGVPIERVREDGVSRYRIAEDRKAA
jgi:biotin operon repressor